MKTNVKGKQKQTHRYREQTWACQRGAGGGRRAGIAWEFGFSSRTLFYIEGINKVLLYNMGNYIQYPVINHNRKEYEK